MDGTRRNLNPENKPTGSRGLNPTISGLDDPLRGGGCTRQSLMSECTVGNNASLDASATQARAFKHITLFIEAFRDGQLVGPVRQKISAIERLPKEKIELFRIVVLKFLKW